MSADFVDQDVIGYHRDGVALEIVVMSIRAGKLSGNRAFSFTGQEFPDAELLSSFVGLYYDMGASVPDELLLPVDIEDAALKAEWLTEQRAAQVRAGARSASSCWCPSAAIAASWSSWRARTRPPASPRAATRAPTPSWRWASCSAG